MATNNIKSAKCASNRDNKNYDKSDVEYKIYYIFNVSNRAYHASYTTQKYLSSVMANFQRKTSDSMKNLFDGGNVRIDLLDVITTDNLFDVKQRIKELLKNIDGMSWGDINAEKFKECWNGTKTVDTYTPKKTEDVKTERPKKHKEQKPKKQKPKELDFNGEVDLSDIDEFEPLPEIKKEKEKEKVKKCKSGKEPIWCQKCNCEVSYTNWSRHQQSKKHTR